MEQIAPDRESASSIFSSVVGFIGEDFDGKAPTMAGDFGRYTMGGIDNNFSEVVRDEVPPLSREEEIMAFWTKVATVGQEARDAKASLIRLAELKENARISGLLKYLGKKHSLSQEGDGGVEGKIEEVGDTSYADAENFLLSILPADLREEYNNLDPINGFGERGVPKFSLLKAQCWVFHRALQIGWDQSLHEKIERNYLRYSHSRHDHRVERIGKKYQHIAFEELTGYLADYHWYLDWNEEPCVLTHLEDFQRADIDATYLSGSFSKPCETYLSKEIVVPEMAFVSDSTESNMAWTETLQDIPDPIPFLIQSGADGHQWCLQHSFCRSKDYMESFESSAPFRSAQYGIELILLHRDELSKLKRLTTKKINQNSHDIFDNSWSSPSLFGQRSFKHQDETTALSLTSRAADFKFARVTESFSPKYSEFDQSGVSDESAFSTPHPALLAELKLHPKDGWSRFFVSEDGNPAFSDNPAFLAGFTVIRHDLIERYASDHNLKIVWRVWVEKDGGLGTGYSGRSVENFARNDFIGFFFEDGKKWHGKLIPFRS